MENAWVNEVTEATKTPRKQGNLNEDIQVNKSPVENDKVSYESREDASKPSGTFLTNPEPPVEQFEEEPIAEDLPTAMA